MQTSTASILVHLVLCTAMLTSVNAINCYVGNVSKVAPVTVQPCPPSYMCGIESGVKLGCIIEDDCFGVAGTTCCNYSQCNRVTAKGTLSPLEAVMISTGVLVPAAKNVSSAFGEGKWLSCYSLSSPSHVYTAFSPYTPTSLSSFSSLSFSTSLSLQTPSTGDTSCGVVPPFGTNGKWGFVWLKNRPAGGAVIETTFGYFNDSTFIIDTPSPIANSPSFYTFDTATNTTIIDPTYNSTIAQSVISSVASSAPAIASSGNGFLAAWVSTAPSAGTPGLFFECDFSGNSNSGNFVEIPSGVYVLLVAKSNGTTWEPPCALYPTTNTLKTDPIYDNVTNVTTFVVTTATSDSVPTVTPTGTEWILTWNVQNQIYIFRASYSNMRWNENPETIANIPTVRSPIIPSLSSSYSSFSSSLLFSFTNINTSYYDNATNTTMSTSNTTNNNVRFISAGNSKSQVNSWTSSTSDTIPNVVQPPLLLTAIPYTLPTTFSFTFSSSFFSSSTYSVLSSSSKGEAQVGFDVNGKYWIVAWVQEYNLFNTETNITSIYNLPLYSIAYANTSVNSLIWNPPLPILSQNFSAMHNPNFYATALTISAVQSVADTNSGTEKNSIFVLSLNSPATTYWVEIRIPPPPPPAPIPTAPPVLPPGVCEEGKFDNYGFKCVNSKFVIKRNVNVTDITFGPYNYIIQGDLSVYGNLILNGSILKITQTAIFDKNVTVIIDNFVNSVNSVNLSGNVNFDNSTKKFSWIEAACAYFSENVGFIFDVRKTTIDQLVDSNKLVRIISASSSVPCITVVNYTVTFLENSQQCEFQYNSTENDMSEISVEFSQKCSASSANSNAGAIGGGVAAAVVVITLVALAIIFGPKLCGEKGDNIDVARYGS